LNPLNSVVRSNCFLFCDKPEPSKPLVSVVIPVYNGERYLAECLESVKKQTWPSIETIVVDDGSTDRSVEIASKDARVRLIRQSNRDVSAARNAGIQASQGEFVAFLDYDDLWLPEKVERQMGCFAQNPGTDVVFTDVIKFDDDGRTRHPQDRRRWASRLNGPRAFQSLAKKNPILPSAVMAKKGSLLRAGLFDERFKTCGDYEMWLRMAGRGMRFVYLDHPLTRYRVHSANTGRKIEVMHDDRLLAVRTAFSDSRMKPGFRRFENGSLASAHVEAANAFFGVGRSDLFLREVRAALKLDPLSINWKTCRRWIQSLCFNRKTKDSD
jgi:glycosyltransferase involved in cell wall biosynthesis